MRKRASHYGGHFPPITIKGQLPGFACLNPPTLVQAVQGTDQSQESLWKGHCSCHLRKGWGNVQFDIA
jgi:hypothetical protein